MSFVTLLIVAAGLGYVATIPFTRDSWHILRPVVPVGFAVGLIYALAGGPDYQVQVAALLVAAALAAALTFFVSENILSFKNKGE